ARIARAGATRLWPHRHRAVAALYVREGLIVARSRSQPESDSVADQVLEAPEATMLDLLDNLLNKGVMANGDVTLGVAGIDLIYLRLSALLCAADRVLPRREPTRAAARRPRRRGKPPLL